MAEEKVEHEISSENPESGSSKSTKSSKSKKERLSRLTKLYFGLPTAFTGAIVSLMASWMPYYYSDVVKVRGSVFAPVTACIVAAYALAQPFIGTFSDLSDGKNKWCIQGRRRPFLAVLCFPAAVCHSLCFNPPQSFFEDGDHGLGEILYIVLAGCGCMGCIGGIEVMIQAMIPIVARTYDQRTEMGVVSSLSFALGFASASLLPAFWNVLGLDEATDAMKSADEVAGVMGRDASRTKFAALSIFFSIGTLFSVVLFVAKVYEPEVENLYAKHLESRCCGFREMASLLTWPSLLFLVYYTLCVGSTASSISLMPFFAKFVLCSEGAFVWAPVVASSGPILCAPLWIFLMYRWEKRTVLCVALLAMAVACLLAICAPQGNGGTPTFFAATGILAVGVGGYACSPGAMKPDICDYDELRHQVRREGRLLSLWLCSGRLASALSMGTSLAGLSLAGYDPKLKEQPASAKEALRYVGFGLPAIAYLVAALTMRKYPIGRQKLKEVQDGVQACKNGEEISDPISPTRKISWILEGKQEGHDEETPVGSDRIDSNGVAATPGQASDADPQVVFASCNEEEPTNQQMDLSLHNATVLPSIGHGAPKADSDCDCSDEGGVQPMPHTHSLRAKRLPGDAGEAGASPDILTL